MGEYGLMRCPSQALALPGAAVVPNSSGPVSTLCPDGRDRSRHHVTVPKYDPLLEHLCRVGGGLSR